jgi:tripartite-type tricarboxylate transporter receptor subunit TctC
VSRLHSEITAILKQPDMEKRLLSEGVELVAGSPEAFDQLVKSETVRWAKVIKQAGIKGE